MASNLLKKGFSVTIVGNRRPEPVARLRELGAMSAETPAEAARNADVAVIVLPSSREVEAVIEGENGLLAGLREGAVVVDCSTSDPQSTRRLGALLEKAGIGFVDAGLTRGVAGAKDGKLAFFVGGKADDFAKAEPVLSAMGDTFFQMGPLGSGHVAKLLSNSLSYGTVALVNETLMLGGKLGLDLGALQQALMAGAGSKALESFGPRIIKREFASPRVSIGNVCAHLDIAQNLASATSAPLFVTAAAQGVYRWAEASGHGRSDMSSIADLWSSPAAAKAAE